MSDVASFPETGLGLPAAPPLQLSLRGEPVDARLPLALLEAVRLIDTPEGELESEYVDELRSKRFGLSDTVMNQIRRYANAVRTGNKVGYEEVLLLARLIGRRSDAELAFREAGRRWSRSIVSSGSSLQLSAARRLPAFLARPLALRVLRRLVRRHLDGTLVREGSTVVLQVVSPVSADAAPHAAGCLLYETALRELLIQVAGSDGPVDHIACRSRMDASCQWRTNWSRR